jgi:hypothetical protein
MKHRQLLLVVCCAGALAALGGACSAGQCSADGYYGTGGCSSSFPCSDCAACQVGKYCPSSVNNGKDGARCIYAARSCPANTYSAAVGATSCTPCPTGMISSAGATACTATDDSCRLYTGDCGSCYAEGNGFCKWCPENRGIAGKSECIAATTTCAQTLSHAHCGSQCQHDTCPLDSTCTDSDDMQPVCTCNPGFRAVDADTTDGIPGALCTLIVGQGKLVLAVS